jgi:hypothetical protein
MHIYIFFFKKKKLELHFTIKINPQINYTIKYVKNIRELQINSQGTTNKNKGWAQPGHWFKPVTWLVTVHACVNYSRMLCTVTG